MQTSLSQQDIGSALDRHSVRRVNQYELAARCETTGWNPLLDDVNGINEYGMRPIEVAAQAGDAGEFASIMNHPDYDSVLGRPRLFFGVGRSAWEHFDPSRLVRMQEVLEAHLTTFGRV